MSKKTKAAAMQRLQKKKQQTYLIIAVVSILCLIGLGIVLFQSLGNKGNALASSGKGYIAEIKIKDYGTITVELDADAAPITVENFVELAESGFYDGLTFHRIIEGFMMQGGDPNGNGSGGSANKIKGEFLANGVNNTLSHTRGAISMARSNAYDSASSQFFIVHQDSKHLDGSYAVFGYVTSGMDIVDKICTSAEPTDNNGTIPKEKQPIIETITIREK